MLIGTGRRSGRTMVHLFDDGRRCSPGIGWFPEQIGAQRPIPYRRHPRGRQAGAPHFAQNQVIRRGWSMRCCPPARGRTRCLACRCTMWAVPADGQGAGPPGGRQVSGGCRRRRGWRYLQRVRQIWRMWALSPGAGRRLPRCWQRPAPCRSTARHLSAGDQKGGAIRWPWRGPCNNALA